MSASPRSAKTPTSTALAKVPKPGLCLIGIQNNSTIPLMMMVHRPKEIPVVREAPWANTSHGEAPMLPRIINEMAIPYRKRPTTRRARRTGRFGVVTRRGMEQV
ncbi:hypothetical protein CVV68_14890 [Arthrobacter livingstonensis]|uniref:Uncharacterized protein n=1 Tax=Arthrobacter livingstonensis TaxID=670078 RepID=A0A2V5L7L4_9MICC|nr:hypothetical protein CVV68_14890 [Arthrobacter livingstonensis]